MRAYGFCQGLRTDVEKHFQEKMASHVMDMAKKLGKMLAESGDEEAPRHRGVAARRTRGGMESIPREQASQEGVLNELSTRTQYQRDEIDEIRRVTNGLRNTVTHLERQLEEARIRQERPVQELTLR